MNLKKMTLVISLFLLIMAIPVKADTESINESHVILIDPGHGGIDGGAHSKRGTIEKDINLQISKKLQQCLMDAGYTVHMTREDDAELDRRKAKDLGLRCTMKKDTNCEVFVSIHQNMFPQAKCFGAQVWYSSNDKSKLLADFVQNAIKDSVGDQNKRISKAAKEQYKILRDGYDGACILVECGFLSNPEEEQKLKSEEHQDKIVNGIKTGIDNYFNTEN